MIGGNPRNFDVLNEDLVLDSPGDGISSEVVESALNGKVGDGHDLDALSIDGGDRQRLELDERGNDGTGEGWELGGKASEGVIVG